MDKIDQLLHRGVDTVYPTTEALEKVLKSGKKLTLYQGFDPTGIQMHIGHMVGFRKLAQFQKLGHKVIFLIGDGTGLAGDPSGKTRAREKFLTRAELRANALDYVKQASKLVDFEGENPIEIKYNGDWLTKLTLQDILEIAGNFTLQQLEERDLFEKRKKEGQPINMREFLYPLLQGYDSVAMKVDLELGGSDQMFNMLAGRQLVQQMLGKEKFVMTTPLLTDSEGRKIGKTEGNVIALNDKPEDLFGKIMALSDNVIVKGLEYLTDIPMEEVQTIEKQLKQGEHPVRYKKMLAYEIVKQLNDEKAAHTAQEHFEKIVQNKELPPVFDMTNIPTFQISSAPISGATITNALMGTATISSRSEAKRLAEQGGISIINQDNSEQRVTDPDQQIASGTAIKVGKRTFIKVEK